MIYTENAIDRILDVLSLLTNGMENAEEEEFDLGCLLHNSINQGLDNFFNSPEWRKRKEINRTATERDAQIDVDGLLHCMIHGGMGMAGRQPDFQATCGGDSNRGNCAMRTITT